MSMFWQLCRPALARKAGQRDPQTLVGGLGADHGTSRSKSGKKFSPSTMTLRTQAAKDKNITQRAAAARNRDAAITMRFPASRGKPACLDIHGNKT